MKTYRDAASKGLKLFTICSAAAALFCGCSTTVYKKGDAAADSYREAAWQVHDAGMDLELTMNSLNNLVNKPAADLKPQFVRYGRALDRFRDSADRNDKAAEQLAEKNSKYLENWDRELGEMNFEAIRARSEARKAEVMGHFEAVNRRYTEARSVIQPLVQYLDDIRHALDTDLTPGGLEAIKPVVMKANENAGKVQAALGRLTTELAASSTSMSSVTGQTAATPLAEPVEPAAR